MGHFSRASGYPSITQMEHIFTHACQLIRQSLACNGIIISHERIIFQNIAKRFGTSFEVIKPHLDTALASAADPERSLVYLERLLESADESLLPALVKNPRVIESLVTIFSGSQFLTEIILRNPSNVHLLHQPQIIDPA